MKLLKDRAYQNRLKAFDRWEAKNKPSKTDLSALERKLET